MWSFDILDSKNFNHLKFAVDTRTIPCPSFSPPQHFNDRPSSEINGQDSLQHRVGFRCCVAALLWPTHIFLMVFCFLFFVFFSTATCVDSTNTTCCLTHACDSNVCTATVPAVCDDRVPTASIKTNTVRNGTIYAKTPTKHGLSILLQHHESLQQSLWPRLSCTLYSSVNKKCWMQKPPNQGLKTI